MMNRRLILIYLVLGLLMLLPLAIGQDTANVIEPIDMDMVNPEASISFPPPVYVVRDSVDIRGTVTLADLRNFFVEFRPLVLDMMAEGDSEEDNQWFPATLPRIVAVTDDVLGTWNTVTLRDGLYELRLTINTGGDSPLYFRVSPIRVENNPPEFVAEQQVVEIVEPTAVPEPTATPDTSPRVVALVNSNVRAGDSTSYVVVGSLMEGESAKIKGISSFGTGWFYIELNTGRSGFIHPNIVRGEGDLSALPRINPPPLPPTPIPPPTAVPVATNGPNLRFVNVVIDPHPATCNRAYRIEATIINDGNAAATNGGYIRVKDSRDDGAGPVETRIGFTPLAAGQQGTFTGHLTQNQWFNELHNINLTLDAGNEVAEINENDNHHATAPYILQQGSC